MPCPDCGASVDRNDPAHECDPERRLDFVLFRLRDEIAAFAAELAKYLGTPHGRFEVYYAERERRRE
jgi:hypothetical protein